MNNEMFAVKRFVAASATQNIPSIVDSYTENYVDMGGEFFNASGKKKSKGKKRRAGGRLGKKVGGFGKKVGGVLGGMLSAQRSRRDLRAKSKAEERTTQAKSQLEAAKAMGKSAAGDAAIARALGSDKKQKGMSTTTKIAIGVGALLVLGIVGFVLIKRGKK
jgi:hypothetical protein